VTTLALRLEQKLQTLAFNASLTPDPFLGEVVEITLTNNVTAVNEPPAYALYSGIRFTLVFIQDGTGGRTVAGFNAAYKVVWSDTGNTANKRSSITFERDKANTAWSMVGAQSPYA
jgi:aminopeptidase C